MADIIKSAPPADKRLYQESLEMISGGLALGKMKALFVAGALFNVHELALWRLEGFTKYADWLESIGISERTDRRYRLTADGMKKFIAEKTGQDLNGSFTFNGKVIKEHFADSIRRDLNVLKLAEVSRNLQQFENYLNGADITQTEVMKFLKPSEEVDVPKQLPAKEASDLLSRMKEKGYVWSAVNKRFENPDGSPLSLAQIGEFVSEDDVMGFVRQTKDSVESFKKTTATRIGSYSIFFEAFLATSHSPESKRKLSEEVESLVKEAQTLSGEILELLPEEPTHA